MRFTRFFVTSLLLAVPTAALTYVTDGWRAARPLTRHPLFRPTCAAAATLLLAAFVEPSLVFGAPVVFGALTEGQYTGEFILTEQPGTLSRDTVTVTVPANTTLSPGAVLGQVAATGKYVQYDDSASDGREDAAAILYSELVNDTGADVDKSGVILNFGAEVRLDDLVFEAGVDEDKAVTDLAALFVKARE